MAHEMPHEKKLAFVHQMTKLGLQHFDGGGVITAGNSNPLSGVAGALTAQNSYIAQAPTSSGTVGNQQAVLAQQLQNESAGGGPNPAQTQYLQNTNKIAGQQAETYAQNRALNPALAAREAGNTAANVNQNAAATAGTQQAEQQIAAQQQLEGLTGQEQAGSLGAAQINAGTSQNNANAVNQQQQGILGNVIGAIPGVGSLFSKGGMVPIPKKMAGGGLTVPNAPTYQLPTYGVASNADSVAAAAKAQQAGAQGAKSIAGKFTSGSPAPTNAPPLSMPQLGDSDSALTQGSDLSAGSLTGVPAAGAPAAPSLMGGLDLSSVASVAPLAAVAAKGMKVKADQPSEKAKVKGDSYSNDKVPALLSEGELVIDRDTMQDPGMMGQMARALAKHIEAKKGKKK